MGFDPREQDAYRVCERSIRKHSSISVEVKPLILDQLGIYKRPTTRNGDRLYDEISAAPMSTEFALTRFLVPFLEDYKGWSLFCDCDFLWRADVAELFSLADQKYAVQVVKHNHRPLENEKMDGQLQTIYPRKNWSSLVLWNNEHLSNAGQLDRVNRWPGLHLHQFRWLRDEEIGDIPAEWNWLEHSPKAVHFTRGVPSMLGYENVAFSDEWRAELDRP